MIYGNYLREKYINTAVKLADAEGVPCVMEYSKGKNLRNYEIYGNSVQDGTPSPDTPIEIQSVGDLTTKNLLPYPYIYTTKTINGVTFTDNGDGSITIDGTATANAVFYLVGKQDNYTLDKCGLKIGDSYTISKTLISGDSIANVYFMANYYNTSDSMKQGAIATSDNTSTSTIKSDFKSWGIYLLVFKDKTVNNTTIKLQFEKGSTATEYEPYHKYDIPITVRGKNLLPNSDWMSGNNSNGFTEQTNVDYITEYTQNSISFNLNVWKGVSSQRFKKGSIKRIVFKINQNQINSDDGYMNFSIVIQGYDDNNNKVGSRALYSNAVADTEYVFDFSTIIISNLYKNSTQFSFCILSRKNALSNFMVYDIAYYADTDTAVYEPYIGETKHIYLNEPLRKVGDYADYIDFKNQKVMRQIEVLDDTGTKSIDESLDVISPPAEESVSLPILKTVKGTTIISVDTSIQPSNIKGKYIRT